MPTENYKFPADLYGVLQPVLIRLRVPSVKMAKAKISGTFLQKRTIAFLNIIQEKQPVIITTVSKKT